MRNQKTETERLTGDRENFRSLPKKQKWYSRSMRGFRAVMLAFFAAAQLTFLTACSVNIPMVSDSAVQKATRMPRQCSS